jgi:hypothetical protein
MRSSAAILQYGPGVTAILFDWIYVDSSGELVCGYPERPDLEDLPHPEDHISRILDNLPKDETSSLARVQAAHAGSSNRLCRGDETHHTDDLQKWWRRTPTGTPRTIRRANWVPVRQEVSRG